MEKKDLIELTLKLYKITLLFPKKEPLRYKIRETADKILEEFVLGKEIERDLELMDSYLEIAKWQNWVSFFDVLNLKNEYDKIKDSFPKQEEMEFEPIIEPASAESFGVAREEEEEDEIESVEVEDLKDLSDRKKKILEILKEKEMVQVWEINEILPDVSKRTLRRDFEQLVKDGYVQRVGETNKTFYKLS